MKRPTAILAAALLAALPLFAEDKTPAPAAPEPPADASLPPIAPAEKDRDRLELMPGKAGQLLPPPTNGLPLIPDMPLPPPDKSRPRSVEIPLKKRNSVTEDAEDAVKLRVRLREAKTKAQRDPAVQAEWDRGATVKTEYERREILKNYYKLLYARMTKVDPTLKASIDAQLTQALGRLTQTHIAPTQPPGTATAGR